MDAKNAVQTISEFAVKGIHAGTQVTRRLLDNLAKPDEKLKIIHIAGTNGKGSTAEFFTRILISAGKKVGTFTSPMVYDYYDQFRIDGEQIPPKTLEKYFSSALKASDGIDATEFEIQTAGVLFAFACEGCEYAVVECGMGGLNDATNAINIKELAVITSISLEHTAYLGGTVESICAHKSGIIKNCPAVVNPLQPSRIAKEYFEKNNIRIADEPYFTAENSDGRSFRYKGKNYCLLMPSAYQAYNAVTAIEGARILGIPESAIAEGLRNTSPRGRIEFFKTNERVYVLDGAHNPCAFQPLRHCIERLPNGRKIIIYGCLSDKDAEGSLSALAGLTEEIIAVKCESPRAMPIESIESACSKYFENVYTATGITEALERAEADFVVVCGSFTLLKEAKQWIEKKR